LTEERNRSFYLTEKTKKITKEFLSQKRKRHKKKLLQKGEKMLGKSKRRPGGGKGNSWGG